MKKTKAHRRLPALTQVQPETIPFALVRAHARSGQYSSPAEWENDLLKVFGEWIKFAQQYAGIDPDAKATVLQAERGQCECAAIATTIGNEQNREQFFSRRWWELHQSIITLATETGAKWSLLKPEQQAEYNRKMNEYLSEKAAAEHAWQESSGKISYLNQQLRLGCSQYFDGLIRKPWAERKETLRNSADYLYEGGGKVRMIYSQRYQGARQPVLETVIARNRLAGVAQKLTGKPFHALSVSIGAYLGDQPSTKVAPAARARPEALSQT